MTRPFTPYYNFWSNDLDLELTLNVILICLPLGELCCLLTTVVFMWDDLNSQLHLDDFRWFNTRNAHMVHIVNYSDLKWRINLSRRLFLYLIDDLLIRWFSSSTTWWVSLLVDQGVPEGTCSQVLRSTSVES